MITAALPLPQIIEWFEECAEEFFQTNTELGESLDIAVALVMEVQQFETSTQVCVSLTEKWGQSDCIGLLTKRIIIPYVSSLVPSLHCQLFFFVCWKKVGKKWHFLPTCKKKLAVETGYEAKFLVHVLSDTAYVLMMQVQSHNHVFPVGVGTSRRYCLSVQKLPYYITTTSKSQALHNIYYSSYHCATAAVM